MLRAFFAALVLVVVPLSAPAHAGWSTPTFLTKSSDVAYDDRTVLESNPAGDMVAAYLVDDALGVAVRRMPRGGNAWGAPKTFAREGDYFYNLRGAIDAQGRSCLVWESHDNTIPTDDATEILAACYRPGAGWSSAKSISKPGVDGNRPVVVVVGGVATVVWSQEDRIASRRWVNGVWQKRKLSSQFGHDFAIGGDAAGRVTLAAGYIDAESHRVTVRTISPTGSWGKMRHMCSTAVYCTQPGLAVNQDGTALITWRRGFYLDPNHVAEARHRLKQGKWGATEIIFEGDGSLEIGVTSNGVDNVFAVWTFENFDGGNTLRSTHRFANGSWSPQAVVDISSTTASAAKAVGQMDSKKVVTYVWRRGANADILRNRVLSDGETVQTTQLLSDPLRESPYASDDLAITLRGKREIHALYIDTNNVSPYRVSWAKFTP